MECARAGRAGERREGGGERHIKVARESDRYRRTSTEGLSEAATVSDAMLQTFEETFPALLQTRECFFFSPKTLKMVWYAQRRCHFIALGSNCPPAGAIGRARDDRR